MKNLEDIKALLNKLKTQPEQLSEAESMSVIVLQMLRCISDLEVVNSFIEESMATGKPTPGTLEKVRFQAIPETVELLSTLHPLLCRIEAELQYVEDCDKYNLDGLKGQPIN